MSSLRCSMHEAFHILHHPKPRHNFSDFGSEVSLETKEDDAEHRVISRRSTRMHKLVFRPPFPPAFRLSSPL
ncbi:hypothetical protein PsorP6_016303 [Peronosclerospora sorghi]|uniref:Uncharacterized protein n=1 Tax=Peronosclerospora sorghi TaxID=230839 RepID=A0ACC0VM51_9STRA|nr:hypothetical protein PsorP6_016303 [Peronosclerospora sorghi]